MKTKGVMTNVAYTVLGAKANGPIIKILNAAETPSQFFQKIWDYYPGFHNPNELDLKAAFESGGLDKVRAYLQAPRTIYLRWRTSTSNKILHGMSPVQLLETKATDGATLYELGTDYSLDGDTFHRFVIGAMRDERGLPYLSDFMHDAMQIRYSPYIIQAIRQAVGARYPDRTFAGFCMDQLMSPFGKKYTHGMTFRVTDAWRTLLPSGHQINSQHLQRAALEELKRLKARGHFSESFVPSDKQIEEAASWLSTRGLLGETLAYLMKRWKSHCDPNRPDGFGRSYLSFMMHIYRYGFYGQWMNGPYELTALYQPLRACFAARPYDYGTHRSP